jgi:hypothetical protein
MKVNPKGSNTRIILWGDNNENRNWCKRPHSWKIGFKSS